ncbi:uncharacterized protein BDZ83DRAFT_623982 [Colletotrichum acutatum]|uniref:Uncharacterized protein n=1 Tax=Glomerella acutata TaxID=27357 RepID=A0AAD8XI56_GLOAC|nr:uncharacterized protein BDZ83DRAFT_623982 [Colletotrichum acutatum]KAK1724230.1 hypothetical protein BDZ83DRAFT_623982 [Colletotrichum acutatum]
MSNFSLLDRDTVNANMQLVHGTLVHNGRSLDGQEYQRGDPVAIVDAIVIRDPELHIYESSMGRKPAPLKPFHIPTTSFATKPNTRIVAEGPKARPYGSIGEQHMDGMIADANPRVNFVSMPQNESSNYVPEQRDQQRQGANAQEPRWATRGTNADNGNAWDTLQMPPQHVPEMRQPQLPMPHRLAEEQGSSHSHSGSVGHRPQQMEAIHTQNGHRAGHLLAWIPSSNDLPSFGDVQMHPRGPDQSNRLPMPGLFFPTPEEFYDIQSNHPTSQPLSPLPASSYSQVQEDSLPSTSQSQQSRHIPHPDDSHPSITRGTQVMACRAPTQPVHTFTPSGIIDSFRQSTQAHISSLESHCEQLQQIQASDDQLRQANESLQAARRNNEESLRLLGLLQPITDIPFKGTEKRLQSIADQIVDAIKSLLPDCSDGSDKTIEQLGQKVQSLKEFIEYVEEVHPEVVKRPQDPATASTDNSQTVPVTTVTRVPSTPASVSSHTADESDSCRWVDSEATPPPDRSAAMALNQDRSRMFRDMTAAHGRRHESRIDTAPESYALTSYSQPSSRIHSPLATHCVPAEPPHAAGHGCFQQPLPAQVPQTVPIADFGAPMQRRTMQAYPPPTSVEMTRPMQPVSSLPPQHYTTQQESNFYLRPPPQNCLSPTTGARMAQTAYAPRSSVDYAPAQDSTQSNYYQEVRSGLPDRRTVRQERPAPYSLNYRDQRRRRESQ